MKFIMKKTIRITCISISFLMLLACKEEKKEQTAADIPTIEVTSVKKLQPSSEVVLPGELKPWNKTHIHAKVKGFVGRVFVDRGDHAKTNQVLAVLEAPEILSELRQAQAKFTAAEAAVVEQQARKHVSRLTYNRLLETSKTAGAVSPNELDLTYAQMMTDSARTGTVEENRKAAQALLKIQEQLVDYLSVRAPFDGIITERNVSPGELVGLGGSEVNMFVMEDRSTLRLTIAVPENLSNSIPQGRVSFSVQANPLEYYEATFGRMANSLQESNRTMLVEFDYDNRTGNLKAGMYAEVRIPVKREASTLFVPQDALIHSTEGVFLVKVNVDKAEWVRVKKGTALDSLVEIFGSVKEGDKVVVHAYDELRNGQMLKVKNN